MRRLPAIVVVLVLGGLAGAYAAAGATSHGRRATATKRGAFKLPRVRHVFFIVLENEDYASTFGEPSADPYLATTLPAEGALLQDY
jgi:hypothetical protein